MEKKQQRKSVSVASIETDYVRSMQKKENWRQTQKKRLRKKLIIYTVILIITFGGLIQTYISQKKDIAAKEAQKIEMLAELEQVQEQQKQLKRQLIKLDDDDYIAKLARKEYFLSNQHEIIFSIPEFKKEKDKKSDGKE
ncbi:septum formation initiator family protein [Sporosarcina sp. HYO08]|uniref:FtsB family cell division protein n=1 Tax=Sporosarcina sp. HYO08 TaxID=1759557 RepID=UPI000798110F|nr:septum formation initiator family protein [Sporosarcina sp. HYO08]KXH86817.1 hypothetical protein AU377_13945 [Sporosarcina sp. HYO08]